MSAPGGTHPTTMTLAPNLLRSSLVLSLGLVACDPESLSLGDDVIADTDDPPTDPIEPVQRWRHLVDDVSGIDLALGPDGTIHVIGLAGYHYEGGDSGYFDSLWLGKHDADGNLLWEHTEPVAGGATTLSALAVDDQGDVYISIIDYSVLAGGGNVVRKIDADGTEEWTAVLPARAEALAAIPGGGVIAGGSQEAGANNGLAWVQAFDADGNPGWEQTFGDPAMRYSEISAIAVTDDGGAVLGGRIGIEPASSRARAWVAAVELSDGSLRYETLLSDGVATDRVYDLGLTADGTTLALGTEDGAWVQAIDPSGSQMWTWPTEEVAGGTIAVFPDGGFALGDGQYLDIEDPDACWGPFSPCPVAMRLARYAADRMLRWSLTTDECRSARVTEPTADGGLLVLAGCDEVPDYGPVAMGLLRYDEP